MDKFLINYNYSAIKINIMLVVDFDFADVMMMTITMIIIMEIKVQQVIFYIILIIHYDCVPDTVQSCQNKLKKK